MGCCCEASAKSPPPTHIKGAFSDYMEKNEHLNGDTSYTLNNANSNNNKLSGAGNKSTSFYESRSTKIKSTASAELVHLHNPSSRSNSTDHSHNSTKQLLKAKKHNTRTNHAMSNPLPFKKQTFDSSLSPNDAPHPSPAGGTMQNRNKLSIQSNTATTDGGDTEREYSMSKSRSRQFRRRTEPRSPDSQKQDYKLNEPPPIEEEEDDYDDDDEDAASSLSDEVEIPGLKPIVFSDNEDDDDIEDDENLKIMELLVAQENERLAQEIDAMKEHIYEQETIKMKRDAMQEIMKEMAAQHEQMESKMAEEEKKRKAMERYEKMQKQRLKEKEEAKERRRLKKEERERRKKASMMKKKMAQRQKARAKKRDEMREQRKKELETYAVSEQKPTKQEILRMFEKYFYQPFERSEVRKDDKKKQKKESMSDMTDDSDTDTSSDEELGEGGVDFAGFTAGLKRLGIDAILNKSEIEMLFDHMGYSSRDYGINAVDFCHFLKTNTVTMEPKMATLHRKVLSTVTKQQEKEPMEKEEEAPRENNTTGSFKIQISEPMRMKPPQINIDAEVEDEDGDTPTSDGVPETPTQKDFATGPETPKERRDDSEISITESMTMSEIVIPSNIPRKSFKQINLNWNDSISSKSFNNYKRLRQKFGLKYNVRRTHNQTKDKELAQIQDQLMREKSLKDVVGGSEEEDREQKQEEEAPTKEEEEIPPHHVSTSNHNNHAYALPGIDETKEHDDMMRPQGDIEEDPDQMAQPRRSAVASLHRIEQYKGNEKMISLRKLYKRQHQMRQKLERLRKRSLMNFPAPRKPKQKQIERMLDDHTRYLCKELKQCICKNTRYTGLANFGPNGELGIEIEFTSDCDEDGYITGKRVITFKGMKQAVGKGRIWEDVAWNGHKYLPCTRFEWTDEDDGVTTTFEFDSVKHEIDVDHSFFQGKCIRYPSDLDPQRKTTQLIMHEGFFDFVCVSARRRDIRKNSLLPVFDDMNEMDADQLQKVPKYVRRMSAYTEKIDKLYESEAPVNRDTLFGDAISILPQGINDRADGGGVTSIPEQINE